MFAGFSDQGQVVTPCYWGSHWPLGRGQTTGGAIDARIRSTPSHNSVMSWAMQRPVPLRDSRLTTLDTLGHSKPMQRQTWAWLIGLTDISDAELLERAKSFRSPPSLELSGARLGEESFVQERRAIRLIADRSEIELRLRPEEVCVNPVFQIAKAPAPLRHVTINGNPLPSEKWTWDGQTLWLNATFHEPATLQFKFEL